VCEPVVEGRLLWRQRSQGDTPVSSRKRLDREHTGTQRLRKRVFVEHEHEHESENLIVGCVSRSSKEGHYGAREAKATDPFHHGSDSTANTPEPNACGRGCLSSKSTSTRTQL
jgi:hypothetical protein